MAKKVSREVYEAAVAAVNCNPEAGSLRWKYRSEMRPQWNRKHAGKECGSVDLDGYRRLKFSYQDVKYNLSTHRLIWFIVTGEIPDQIDHINHDRSDNRIANLRAVNNAENAKNKSKYKRNTSGFTGVSWHKCSKKWCAQPILNGTKHHLGLFIHLADAAAAVKKFQHENGFHPNHGSEK